MGLAIEALARAKQRVAEWDAVHLIVAGISRGWCASVCVWRAGGSLCMCVCCVASAKRQSRRVHAHARMSTLTHSLTHSITHSLTHPPAHSPTHSRSLTLALFLPTHFP